MITWFGLVTSDPPTPTRSPPSAPGFALQARAAAKACQRQRRRQRQRQFQCPTLARSPTLRRL